ncbi:hypothetical protein TPY_2172 [Sulfobacillus acidophilus TPY]|nr:hypothetical protein TPY_2172 [Sulfobacillus acidophilus TPY]
MLTRLTLLVLVALWSLPIAVIDARTRQIPNGAIGLGGIVALAWAIGTQTLTAHLLGAAALAAIGLVGYLTGGFGAGDVKYLMVLGLWFGFWRGGLALGCAAAGGALWGLTTWLVTGDRPTTMAFGPWLAVGTILAAMVSTADLGV